MMGFLNAWPVQGSGCPFLNFWRPAQGAGCPFLRFCPFLRGRVSAPHGLMRQRKNERALTATSMSKEVSQPHGSDELVESRGNFTGVAEREPIGIQVENEKSQLLTGLNGSAGLFRVDPRLVAEEPEENLRAFIKTRGSLVPGEEFVFWWTGDVFGLVEDEGSRHLFAFEGYNIGRMMRVDGGWRMLTREVGLYKDPKTREILKVWENPATGKQNEVVHVWNDPVNHQFLLDTPKWGKFKVPTTESGDDLYFHTEFFLHYPSPLPRSQFPERSSSENYQSAEMFQFFTKKSELESDSPSADCQISWVRVGQWLPWMEMGDRPGRMVYHCRGKKLKNGYVDLCPKVRAFIEQNHSEYAQAPSNFCAPNETSWTYFRKLLDAKGCPRADGRIAQTEPEPEPEVKLDASRPTDDNGNERSSNRELKMFSEEDLRLYDGSDAKRPIYLSIGGLVFDVSTASRHYRRGETYNCLTGRDATPAFVTGDLSEDGLLKSASLDVSNLTLEQQRDLGNWVDFFKKHYAIVGKLDSSK